jgi:hypothetical protein
MYTTERMSQGKKVRLSWCHCEAVLTLQRSEEI